MQTNKTLLLKKSFWVRLKSQKKTYLQENGKYKSKFKRSENITMSSKSNRLAFKILYNLPDFRIWEIYQNHKKNGWNK